MARHPSQAQFVLDFFKSRPNEKLHYEAWTDDQEARYLALTGYRARFFRTVTRRLCSQGMLRQVANGVYVFDSDASLLERPIQPRKLTIVELPSQGGTEPSLHCEGECADSLMAMAELLLAELATKAADRDDEKLAAVHDDACKAYLKYVSERDEPKPIGIVQ